MIGQHFGGLGGLLASFLPQQYPQMYGQGPMMHGSMQQPVQPFGGPAQMFSPAAFASSSPPQQKQYGGKDYEMSDEEYRLWLDDQLEGGNYNHTKDARIDDIMLRTKRQNEYYDKRAQLTNDYRYNRISKDEYDRRMADLEREYGDR